jgi:tRNA(fMet)-specific endonuclease VapC
MTYVLDTDVVLALMKGTAAVIERLAAIKPREVGIPQPVLAELACGIARLPPRSRRRQLLQDRLDLVRSELQRTEWTDAVSRAYVRIKAALERRGLQIEDFDAAIAAHALAHGATLVTSNAERMGRVPELLVEDWRE